MMKRTRTVALGIVAALFATTAMADAEGTYIRFGVAGTAFQPVTGRWLPPGYPSDPAVYHDVTGGITFAASGAVGYDFGNGFRADLSVEQTLSRSITGMWSYTVPATAGPHADMETTLSSTAIMANGFYSFDLGDSAVPVTPFVTAGLGVALNHMGEWTRVNLNETPQRRSFEGNTEASLAWSLGAGVSIDLSGDSGMPAFLDLSYRYVNLGNAMGSVTPVGSGKPPAEAFNFTNSGHVIGASIRIPIGG